MGSLYISLRINEIPVMALVDSGSTLSVIHPTVLSRISGEQDMVRKSPSGQLRLADGGLVDTLGTVQLSLRLGSDSYFIQHEMVVAAVEAPAVIGLDFLHGHGCVLDIQKGTLAVRGKVHTCQALRDMPAIFRISMTETASAGASQTFNARVKSLTEAEDGLICVTIVTLRGSRVRVPPDTMILSTRFYNRGFKSLLMV